jgi:5-methyltetrahydropteroyltriglutamate--homocysteine methyltransferase
MPHFHTDVVGSLLRPAWLLAAREQVERGALTAAAFKQIEDRAVDEAVALQQDTGLEIITDGELRRYAFYGHRVDALEGFDKHSGWSITFRDDAGRKAQPQRPVVVDKLSLEAADGRRGVHLPARPHDAAAIAPTSDSVPRYSIAQ